MKKTYSIKINSWFYYTVLLIIAYSSLTTALVIILSTFVLEQILTQVTLWLLSSQLFMSKEEITTEEEYTIFTKNKDSLLLMRNKKWMYPWFGSYIRDNEAKFGIYWKETSFSKYYISHTTKMSLFQYKSLLKQYEKNKNEVKL